MALAPINPTQLTPPRVPLIDDRSGAISREWYRFFLSLLTATQANQSEVELAPDTTSLLATYDAMLATVEQSSAVTSDGMVASLESSLNNLQNAFGVTPPDLGGTVTSVAASGGATGLTFTGSPITTSGTLTLGGTLAVASGGTGTTTAFTTGSVVFAGASGVYTQDNANLFWDDTNNRLGVGTAAPASRLDIGSGDLRFSGAGQRILGDMSNGTIANRLAFQTTTVNGNTNVHIIPNGTATIAGFKVESDSAITTGQVMAIDMVGGSDARISSNIRGAGTYVPLTFYTNAAERMRIDTSGSVGIGASANASAILDVQSTTKGFRLPNMTTVQKNAISSPAAGLMVFDTTLAKACIYSGSAWEIITSV